MTDRRRSPVLLPPGYRRSRDLRRSEDRVPAAREPAAKLLSDPGPVGRIMIVDDDRTLAEVVSRYLVRDGHRVDCLHDGEAALRRLDQELPDLVVLDLMLPGIDALDVCRWLRARWPRPVVMVTALVEEADRVVGFETGADDYVTNPFSPRELALRFSSLLRPAPADTPPPP